MTSAMPPRSTSVGSCLRTMTPEIDPRALGYQLTAIVRVKPAPGQLGRIPELALQIPEVGECHRITGEDCFYLKVHLRSIDDLSDLLDRFLAYGDTTTSIVNASPIPRRDPPVAEALDGNGSYVGARGR
jgi:Lrp/AsnC family leucine-responsive transcriptional regulator